MNENTEKAMSEDSSDEKVSQSNDTEEKNNGSLRTQWMLIFLCWLIYTMSQLGRYSYVSNVNPIMEHFDISHSEASIPVTLFFFSYGAGQIINAFLCKRYNKRLVLSAVLLISGIINLIVFFGVPFVYICVLWFVNGIVQSTLWGSLIATLSENLNSRKMLSNASIVMSTATLGGMFLSYGLSALLAIRNYYKWAFCISGVILLIVCVLWALLFDRVTENKKTRNRESAATENSVKREKSKMSYAMRFTVSTLFLFMVINNFVSGGLQTWLPSILTETYGLSNALSVFLTVFLPFVGIFAAMLSGFVYRRLSDCIIINGIMFGLAATAVILLIYMVGASWITALLLFILVRLVMAIGANAAISRFPLYSKQGNSGFLASMLNGGSYLGQTISTYGFGAIADRSDWTSVFWISFGLSVIGALIAGVYALMRLLIKRKTIKQ